MKPRIIAVSIPPDNYSYIIVSGNCAAVIDPSNDEEILSELKSNKLNLCSILATHHHSDHTAGIKSLKKSTGAVVYGGDRRISSIDQVLDDGDTVLLGEYLIKVLATPGHTRHQVAFYLPAYEIIFTGDTLFGAGCGRIFEGPPDQMYRSLMKLAELPENTLVYFGHEYTLENLEFALMVESENEDVKDRLAKVKEYRLHNAFTTPSTISLEKKTNPFLRASSLAIRKYLGMVDRSPIAVFEELRKRKNNF